jgi:hypothetical protein
MTNIEYVLLVLSCTCLVLQFLKLRQNKEITRRRRILYYDEPDFKFENYGYINQGEFDIIADIPYFDFRIDRYCKRIKSILEKKLDLLE